jgi:hypothetical protein
MTISLDNKWIAIVSSQGTLYIINSLGKLLFSERVSQLGIVDGVASLSFRETTCELQGTTKWYGLTIHR